MNGNQKMININFDEQGLIVQTNGDAGDCAARTGELYTGLLLNQVSNSSIREQFTNALNLLEPNKDGILLRYNKPPYNNPLKGDFATSRDQTIPMIIAAGYYDQRDFLKRIAIKQLKRFTLFQNKDLCDFQSIGNYIRAFWSSGYKLALLFYPLLLLGDLFMLVNSVIRCIKGRNYDDVGDDICHTQSQLQAVYDLPTPVSFLSRKIYSKYRPAFTLSLNGNFIRSKSDNGVQYAFNHYHRPETFGNPINIVYKPLIKRWFT
jgi:hypothetical protein